jgi:hypothetical protein
MPTGGHFSWHHVEFHYFYPYPQNRSVGGPKRDFWRLHPPDAPFIVAPLLVKYWCLSRMLIGLFVRVTKLAASLHTEHSWKLLGEL